MCIDFARRGALELADRNDLVALDRNVTFECGRSRSIDDLRISNR